MAVSYEHLHDFKYDWMTFLRPDTEFFVSHPPFEKLSKEKLWFPTRTPWGGVPAGFVVCPREKCGHWGMLFELIKNGTMVNTLSAKQMLTPRNCALSEIFEFNYYAAKNVEIGFFSAAYALVCAKNLCTHGDQCHKGKSVCKVGQKYKYDGPANWYETSVARRNARRIKEKGWRDVELTYNCPYNRGNLRPFYDRGTIAEAFAKWGDYNALHPAPPFTPLDPF
jgi:hypothetical protein